MSWHPPAICTALTTVLGNIYCWTYYTSPMVARFEDRLIMRLCIGGRCMYAYPVGSGDIRPAVELMLEDSRRLDCPFIIRGITTPMLSQIHSLLPREPVISMNPNSSDYVYLAKDLAELSGKRYHSKKNHVNRFMAEHQWRFEPITPENIHLCHDFASPLVCGELPGAGYRLPGRDTGSAQHLRHIF